LVGVLSGVSGEYESLGASFLKASAAVRAAKRYVSRPFYVHCLILGVHAYELALINAEKLGLDLTFAESWDRKQSLHMMSTRRSIMSVLNSRDWQRNADGVGQGYFADRGYQLTADNQAVP
jgi:hypothetical protein